MNFLRNFSSTQVRHHSLYVSFEASHPRSLKVSFLIANAEPVGAGFLTLSA